MDKLRELVRLHRSGRGARDVARLLGISPNTERRYRRRLRAAGLLAGDPTDLPTLDELQAVVCKPKRPKQEHSSIESWGDRVAALVAQGHGPTAVHEILSDRHDDFPGSLSAVKRLCLRLSKARGPRPQDVAIPVVTDAGDVAQVDFGYVGKLLDPATGKHRKAWVFVMVLGCSRHMFAKVAFDQSIGTWLQLHVDAFRFFGGVPGVVVPDNLKAAVIRAAFTVDDVSVLNRAYRELARHFGFIIDPTPPRSPEKKGKVERCVLYVKDAFFGRVDYVDLPDANRKLAEWVVTKAGQRVHGTTGQRPLVVFEAVEKAAMKPLPKIPFVPVEWKSVTVGRNSHVAFGQAFWSVPWKNLAAKALVRATAHQVEIYVGDRLVATHPRLPHARWHTVENHLPEGRRELRHRSRSHWESLADDIGAEVGAYIRAVFDEDSVQQPIRRVASMMRVLQAVSPERADAACRRAAYFGNFKAGGLKRILRDRLDEQPLEGAPMATTWASDPRFARSATSFLSHMSEGGRHGRC